MSLGRRSRARAGVVALLAVLLVSPVVLWPGIAIVGGPGRLIAVVGLAVVVAVLAREIRAGRDRGEERPDDRDEATGEPEEAVDEGAGTDNSVWNAIPSRQYGGRHVESGGLTREEQEKALNEIQARAEEIERLGLDDRDP